MWRNSSRNSVPVASPESPDLLHILGRRVEYPESYSPLDRWLRENWDFPVSARSLKSAWRVQINRTSRVVPAAISESRSDPGQYGIYHVRPGPNEFWVHEGESGVLVETEPESATIMMYGEPFSAWLALHSGLTEALCASRLIRLHGAAMGKDDRTIVLLGPSGRGKSTTLLRGLAAGWQPIAEDGCWLEPVDLRIFGVDRAIRLLPDALPVLADVDPSLDPQAGRGGKLEVSFEELGGRLDDRPMTDIVLVERKSGSDSSWLPLSNTEAVMALYEAIGVPHTGSLRDFLAPAIGTIVERVDCTRLRLGTTPLPL